MMVVAAEFANRLAALTTGPGCYLFHDARGDVIYVGKAASLRNRVRSYFQSRVNLDPKTRELASHIADFEVIRTDTPAEALILENELIKRYQPKYNVMLKDGKTYPYIRITNEEWPRVISTRRIVNDGSRYFGPFTSAGSVHTLLDMLNRLFPYRPCDIQITGNAERPCLYYHIGRCLGPCIGVADHGDYLQVIENVALFLNGRGEDLVPQMQDKMEEHAENLEFEQAAKLRDEISAIEHVLARQKIVSGKGDDLDVLALAQTAGGDAGVQVAMIRNGKMLGSEHFLLRGTRVEDQPAELLTTFVSQFYEDAALVPPEIVVEQPLTEPELIEGFLADRRGGRVKVTVAQRGKKRQLIDMVAKSAAENLEQSRLRWLNNEQKLTMALSELSDALLLQAIPRRIECFDISTLQGTNTVAAMVVFQDGKPNNKEYRRFKIKEVQGQDDFASMREVIGRRFKRATAVEATESWRSMPDLVIIDGGKGQLNAGLEALRELEVEVPVVGLAKENEEIFLPGRPDPIVLPRDSQALYLVQRVRDETHRFAVTFHRERRAKTTLQSDIDLLPGVGPKRKKALIQRFGSVRNIRAASLEEIASVDGISQRLAEQIKAAL
jgi:excinuclease ABC subunit C